MNAPTRTGRLRAAVFALVATPFLLLTAGCAAGGYGYASGPDVGVDYYAPYGGDYGFYGDGGYYVGPYGGRDHDHGFDRGGHDGGRGGGRGFPSIPGGGGHGFGGGGHMGGGHMGGGGGHGGGGHR